MWLYSKNMSFAFNWTLKFLRVLIPAMLVIGLMMFLIRLFSDFIGKQYGDNIGFLTFIVILIIIFLIIKLIEKRGTKI